MEEVKNVGKTCNCSHHKVVPWIIILVGVAFLLANLNILTWGTANIIWPIAIIIVGIMKLTKGKCKCCQK